MWIYLMQCQLLSLQPLMVKPEVPVVTHAAEKNLGALAVLHAQEEEEVSVKVLTCNHLS